MNARLLPLLVLASLAAVPSPSFAEESAANARPNVLFIAVDDLNRTPSDPGPSAGREPKG